VLNEYIGEHLGNGFTAKDFRTWGGTLLAGVELGKHGPPASETEAKRVLAAVMRKVGDELGNTAAVARASYVSPSVVEHYLAGRTIEDFRPKTRRPNLRADEAALMRMLRSKVQAAEGQASA
jgi:DNA topoisomerase-1